MTDTTAELTKEIKKSLALLQTLRDEVRVKLHLAGMDMKSEWKKLEPRLEKVEHAAQEITHASQAAVVEAVKALKKFSASLN